MTILPSLFPIRDLVQQTGVNASTLRAWESRHALLNPLRTPSGHRLYSMQDVDRIRRLQRLLSQGMSLAEIGTLLDETDDMEPLATGTSVSRSAVAMTAWQGYLSETRRALEDFSVERLDLLYNEACALYPIGVVTDSLLIPVMKQLGERWDQHPAGIAEEHFFSAWLRNKLGARLHHSTGPTRGRLLILACLPGENHEIGLLIFALEGLRRNHGVIYLGANMPIRQILPICARTHPAGIVLAGRDIQKPAKMIEDIAWLSTTSGVPVFVGSHFSVNAQEELRSVGVTPLGINPVLALRTIEQQLGYR